MPRNMVAARSQRHFFECRETQARAGHGVYGPASDGLAHLRCHFAQITVQRLVLEPCLHQAAVVTVVVAIPEHQSVREDASDDLVPSLFVGKHLIRVNEREAVGLSAVEIYKRDAKELLHYRIAESALAAPVHAAVG